MALVDASAKGDLDKVKTLLTQGSSVNETDPDGATGLHRAAVHNYAEVIKYLVQKGADINKKDQVGRTPLMYSAACAESSAPCKILLKAGARIEDLDNKQFTALQAACDIGIIDTVRLLIQSGADVSKRDIDGYQAVHRAAGMGSPEIIDTILSHGGNTHSATNNYGFLPLHLACITGKEDNVEKLIERGAAVNAKSVRDGTTALYEAVCNNNARVVQILLQQAANANATRKNGYSPLLEASEQQNVPMVRLLMRNKADPMIASEDWITPLHSACLNGNLVLVRLLLPHSDPNCPTQRGETPLQLSAKKGNPEICRILLDTRKVDVDSSDLDGNSVLHCACQSGCTEIVELLLGNQVKTDAKNVDRDTAMVVAAKANNAGCIRAIGHRIVTENVASPLAGYSDSGSRRFSRHVEAESILETPDATLIQFILGNKNKFNF